ncbi:MAG: lactate utilization protein [Deltaproteobacteria bacterium]|nr:lactate utilization protein [Deltaproteobacteria bacterium]
MNTVLEKYNEKTALQIIKELEKKRMAGSFAPTINQAKEEVLRMIPVGATVFRCGSSSLVEMGFWETLKALPNVTVIDPYLPEYSPEEGLNQRRRGLSADIMISSTNAITLNGTLVNLDGMGNRVAAMAFGPRKVILVVGMNKVSPDLDSALKRVKHYAAPLNNIRLNLPNPCTETGLCADCRTPSRICNMWSIIEGQAVKDRIHVKLVGEPMGY